MASGSVSQWAITFAGVGLTNSTAVFLLGENNRAAIKGLRLRDCPARCQGEADAMLEQLLFGHRLELIRHKGMGPGLCQGPEGSIIYRSLTKGAVKSRPIIRAWLGFRPADEPPRARIRVRTVAQAPPLQRLTHHLNHNICLCVRAHPGGGPCTRPAGADLTSHESLFKATLPKSA